MLSSTKLFVLNISQSSEFVDLEICWRPNSIDPDVENIDNAAQYEKKKSLGALFPSSYRYTKRWSAVSLPGADAVECPAGTGDVETVWTSPSEFEPSPSSNSALLEEAGASDASMTSMPHRILLYLTTLKHGVH